MKTSIDIPDNLVRYCIDNSSNAIKYWGKAIVDGDNIVIHHEEVSTILLPEFLKAFGKMAIEMPVMFARLVSDQDLPSIDCLVQIAAFGKIEYQ